VSGIGTLCRLSKLIPNGLVATVIARQTSVVKSTTCGLTVAVFPAAHCGLSIGFDGPDSRAGTGG